MSELHVVFGTGAIGMAVIEALVTRDKTVRAVNRRGTADVPDGVEMWAGDASDATFTRQVCEGADVVYNITNPPYTQWPELFPALQAGVVEGAAAADAKLVVMDNLYMYGPNGNRLLTEDTPALAQTKKGRVRAQMARDLMDAHEDGTVRVTIGRASDYYGPRGLLTAAGAQVFGRAVQGKAAQFIGKPDMPHTYSYIPDIAKGLVTLGDREEALGHIWHLPNAETVTSRQFIEMIYAELGTEPRLSVMPKLMFNVVSLFVPILREVREMTYEFEEPFIVDDSKFKAAFGDISTPLADAIHETVVWFREQDAQP